MTVSLTCGPKCGRRLPLMAWNGMAGGGRRGRGLVELPFRNSFRVSTSVLSAHSLRLISFIHSTGHKNNICIWFPTALCSPPLRLLCPRPAPTLPCQHHIHVPSLQLSHMRCIPRGAKLDKPEMDKDVEGAAQEKGNVDDFHVEHALIS